MQSPLQKNHNKQNDIKIIKTILPEGSTNIIEPKKIFKRNHNCQNSSYNKPLILFNGFEVLHHDKTMPNNKKYTKKDNTN